MFLLLMVIAFLPSSYAYVDCKTACRHCKENREHAILLEVHCAMCRECKLRRKVQQSQKTPFSVMPMKPRPRMRKTPKPVQKMEEQEQMEEHEEYQQEHHQQKNPQQEHVVHQDDENQIDGDYPEGCPTPPECESDEQPVTLKVTERATTRATTAATCPPIPICKKVHRPRLTTHVYVHPTPVYIQVTQAQPIYAQTSCTPCMPMCALPCVQYQPVTQCQPASQCHQPEPIKLTMPPTEPPTEIVYEPGPTEIKTQLIFQQAVNQLVLQQSVQQEAAKKVVQMKSNQGQQTQLQQDANQAIQSANQGQQSQLQQAAYQGIQSSNQAQQQALLQQAANHAIQTLNQALSGSQNQNQALINQAQSGSQSQNQALINPVTPSGIGQPTLQTAGSSADYYYLYLGVPKNVMNKDC